MVSNTLTSAFHIATTQATRAKTEPYCLQPVNILCVHFIQSFRHVVQLFQRLCGDRGRLTLSLIGRSRKVSRCIGCARRHILRRQDAQHLAHVPCERRDSILEADQNAKALFNASSSQLREFPELLLGW